MKLQKAGFQAIITADKHMSHQQAMKDRPFMMVVLDIHPNILANQAACAAQISDALDAFQAGSVVTLDGPHPKRSRQNV